MQLLTGIKKYIYIYIDIKLITSVVFLKKSDEFKFYLENTNVEFNLTCCTETWNNLFRLNQSAVIASRGNDDVALLININ